MNFKCFKFILITFFIKPTFSKDSFFMRKKSTGENGKNTQYNPACGYTDCACRYTHLIAGIENISLGIEVIPASTVYKSYSSVKTRYVC